MQPPGALPPNTLSSHTITLATLALSNNRMFKMENGSFSDRDSLKDLQGSLEAILVSVICATVRGRAGLHDLCCHVLMPEAMLMSCGQQEP